MTLSTNESAVIKELDQWEQSLDHSRVGRSKAADWNQTGDGGEAAGEERISNSEYEAEDQVQTEADDDEQGGRSRRWYWSWGPCVCHHGPRDGSDQRRKEYPGSLPERPSPGLQTLLSCEASPKIQLWWKWSVNLIFPVCFKPELVFFLDLSPWKKCWMSSQPQEKLKTFIILLLWAQCQLSMN